MLYENDVYKMAVDVVIATVSSEEESMEILKNPDLVATYFETVYKKMIEVNKTIKK